MGTDDKKLYTVYWIAVLVALLLTATIWLLDPLLDRFQHLADAGPRWYYWKLPRPELWARVTAWVGYGLHQVAVWALIVRGMRQEAKGRPALRMNYLMLGTNLLFIVLHLVQTHIWYDGLAQDVPIWTSQYSVIIMLVIMLLMLFPARGAFWGKKIKVSKQIMVFLRKSHGIYISWALVYTFWFHPMEGDSAILLGFLYMFLLMIQLSMVNTRIHMNMAWIGFLEFYVCIHGVAVALMNGQDAWTMFLFGFLAMTVFTHIHGLRLKEWVKYVILAAFLGGMAVAYSYRGWERIYEVVFIPSALYGGAFALWFAAGAGLLIASKIKKAKASLQ
jgi:hypothetical protein